MGSACWPWARNVDADLSEAGVRLTMGGEPTYVATSRPRRAEWNTDALGPTKRGYATELVQAPAGRIRRQGGFVAHGPGQVVPGRATAALGAVHLLAQADGQPIWHNPALFADERDEGSYTSDDARRFTQALAAQAGPAPEVHHPRLRRHLVLPVARAQAAGQRRPVRLQADDEMERVRLRRVFSQGLEATVGAMCCLGLQARSR